MDDPVTARYDAALARLVDRRIAELLPSPAARMGTVVTRDPATSACTVIFDGDVIPAPVKRFGHVQVNPGDRVGLQLFESDWVIVGAFTVPGLWVASSTSNSAAVLAETSLISITGVTFRAGMAYRLVLGGQLQGSVVNFSLWRVRNSTATSGADWGQFGHYGVPSASTPVALFGEHWLKRTTASDLEGQTVSVNVNASAGTVTHIGTATSPRYLLIEEWGPAAKCPQGLAI
ncbi:hypothetical protein [Micromonospora tarensis]|uniref:Minor tail protein n=1 Tax=Micromonospora tarensis TaxID=2806100 RepID=A0ABS1YCG0_9ACTN|nr:hypothetical protein [Micromonospora tarensis]MBM0275088.1 hypothetical protein [Micromonospora tarensis]